MTNLINWKITYTAFLSFMSGIEIYTLLYLLALIYLCFFGAKACRSSNKKFFLYPLIFTGLIIYNPAVLSLLTKVINLAPRIRRIFWIMPITIVIAYALTEILFRLKSCILKGLLCLLIFGTVFFKGTSILTAVNITDNPYKIDSEIITIDETIKADSDKENPVIIYSDLNLLQIREYDPSLLCVLGRYELWGWAPDINTDYENTVNEILKTGTPAQIIALHERFQVNVEQDAYLEAISETAADYIILQASSDTSYYEELGFEALAFTDEHIIYRIK